VDEFCSNHKSPVQKVLIEGKEICPQCFLDSETEQLTQQIISKLEEEEKLTSFNTLKRKSILQDQTLLEANFKSFRTETTEQQEDLKAVVEATKKIQEGLKCNLWLYGSTGVGKSHLAMSILKALNQSKEHTCLFVDVDEMLRKIKHSFNDRETRFTEEYFVELLTEVDFLVMDDLGAETGNIETLKQATDWTSKILRAIINGRQDKVTIFTTNLSSTALRKIYDEKLVSRMLRNFKTIVFKNKVDNRSKNIGF